MFRCINYLKMTRLDTATLNAHILLFNFYYTSFI
ncbi:MAG: hypothetical protein JWR38_174 [Mucilaginibacter sp.]|nr:hypothetical protein [Mucilaginibacter sp.]